MQRQVSIETWQHEARSRTGQSLMDYVHGTLSAIDGYTDGHTHRVAEYSLLMAAGVPYAGDLTYLTFAVHDIGKLLIPPQLIGKPGALTPDEYRLVQQHPELGRQLVAGLPELAAGVDVILYHHERWDGEGYPHRLSGLDIPLSARILAVADTFDAMTTDRPYRKRLTLEAARAEIQRCAGTQFDPQVVEAFLEVFPALCRESRQPSLAA